MNLYSLFFSEMIAKYRPSLSSLGITDIHNGNSSDFIENETNNNDNFNNSEELDLTGNTCTRQEGRGLIYINTYKKLNSY